MPVLSEILENDCNVDMISSTIRELQLERAQNDEREAQLIAERRSGVRGAKAREYLLERKNKSKAAKIRFEKRLQFGHT